VILPKQHDLGKNFARLRCEQMISEIIYNIWFPKTRVLAPGAYSKLREEANNRPQVPGRAKMAWWVSSNGRRPQSKRFRTALLLYVSDTGMITVWKGAREAGR
jgi:acyl-CoA thioesterase